MKTYTTSQGQEFTIDWASATTAGFGHARVIIHIEAEEGSIREFYSVTDNMPDFDEATDKEGQEKYEALFELVENSLDGEVAEWLYEINK